MKILIYDKFVSSMGGGEVYMGTLAETLNKSNPVTILSEGDVNKQAFKNRLNVDLSNVDCMNGRLDLEQTRLNIQEDYDLFINATYGSNDPAFAKKNVVIIFFPSANVRKFYYNFKKYIWNILNRIDGWENNFYKVLKEVYNYEFAYNSFGRWTGDELKMNLLNIKLGGNKYIKIKLRKGPKFEHSESIKQITLNGKKVDYRVGGDFLIIPIKNVKASNNVLDLKFNTFNMKELFNMDDTRDLGIYFENIQLFGQSKFRDLYNRFILIQKISSIYSKIKVKKDNWDDVFYLNSYQKIISISKYSRDWLMKYYGKDSEILYPPVDTESFYSSKKEEMIISVGRFFQGGHNKKQDLMIEAFKKLYDSDRSRYRNLKYHVCGGTHPEKKHQIYLNKVKEMASGYPIEIHTDISREELIKLYSKAKVFWHASGYGEDEEKDPDKFEHFGITTVEAMSAGCIPIVIAKAGQKEIIEDGVNGYLWEDVEELIEKTKKVLGSKEDKKMKEAAIKRADYFSKANFEKRTLKIFNNI